MDYPYITSQQLYDLFPLTKRSVLDEYIYPLNDVCGRYNINTINRKAMFLAQTGVESGGYRATKITENMCYSARRLVQIWPNRFPTLESALPYSWDPSDPDREDVALANLVYGARLGNEVNGINDSDGWNFRGRGLIQLTGRSNYLKFANDIKMTLDETTAYMETPMGACEAAAWFWKVNNLNVFADAGDIRGCTRRVNGGYNGLAERESLYYKAKRILGG